MEWPLLLPIECILTQVSLLTSEAVRHKWSTCSGLWDLTAVIEISVLERVARAAALKPFFGPGQQSMPDVVGNATLC